MKHILRGNNHLSELIVCRMYEKKEKRKAETTNVGYNNEKKDLT